MNEVLADAAFFGMFLTLATYVFGTWLKKKFKTAVFNPILISVGLTIIILSVFHIDYDTYLQGARYISYFLTPATVALAVPLYEQFEILKKNLTAVLCGILSGVLASMLSVLGLSVLFSLSHEEYVTFLPKSITTAIGIGVSEELGGYAAVTVAVIILTGILGNVIAEAFLKLARVTEPIAKGIAIGSASHAIGTAKAMEMGEVEGAMSSLSIVVSGIMTVLGAMLMVNVY